MKWILIVLMFHGAGAPGIVQQEFNSARACQDAKVVIIATTALQSGQTYAYCFPVE